MTYEELKDRCRKMASRGRWYYEIEHEGKAYEIRLNIWPAEVVGYKDFPGGRARYEVSDTERAEVIIGAGWKLSKSEIWKETWEEARGRLRLRRRGR